MIEGSSPTFVGFTVDDKSKKSPLNSVAVTLLEKDGTVTQDKRRGSPFVLAKK
jgi:hypothetical protein